MSGIAVCAAAGAATNIAKKAIQASFDITEFLQVFSYWRYNPHIGRVASQGIGKRHKVAFSWHFVILSILHEIRKCHGETPFCFPGISPTRGGLA
jgi:hypothetical protein